jgi:2-hydroxychromene-2-carboxylate isomerase
MDTEPAMRAAYYARQIGRAVAFSLAAFRQAFAAGRDLGQVDNVLIAAAACEMHPKAVLKALDTRAIETGLAAVTAAAMAAGVTELPAIRISGLCFCGADAVERAAAHLDCSGASLW